MLLNNSFYDFFIKKHGISTAKKLENMILSKVLKSNYATKQYIICVFEIALADFWGINENQISNYLRTVLKNKNISNIKIEFIKTVHADVIKIIQSYLQKTENEVKEELISGK